MQRFERRSVQQAFNAHLDPLPAEGNRRARRAPENSAVAQDFLQYSLHDYDRRRRQGALWRDLCPAYTFALNTHLDDWPRGIDGTDQELAAHWEQVRGESRLDWEQVRPVIEDAWLALDHMPSRVIRELRQPSSTGAVIR